MDRGPGVEETLGTTWVVQGEVEDSEDGVEFVLD